jgi:hypothetical protein
VAERAREDAVTDAQSFKRPCPVCLRETLGFGLAWPPKEGHCPLCDVAVDSKESRERVALYLKTQARMLSLVPKARKP